MATLAWSPDASLPALHTQGVRLHGWYAAPGPRRAAGLPARIEPLTVRALSYPLLRFLGSSVASEWYPADPIVRARIDQTWEDTVRVPRSLFASARCR